MPDGASICHCTRCHATFANLTGFDAHLEGPVSNLTCLAPALVGYEQDHRGVWSTPERIAANASLRSRVPSRRR